MVSALDETGQQLSEFVLAETPSLGLTNAIGMLGTNAFSEVNFSNGQATTTFTASVEGQTEISVNYKGQTFKSPVVIVKSCAHATSAC